MMRILFVLLTSLALFTGGAPTASAALFEQIIPEQCFCERVTAPSGNVIPSAPDWGCVLETLQNVINFVISLGFLIALLYIVYTGFLFVMSAGNPGQREAAKTRLMNVVIGMLVVLSAWLLVDFIMRTLYDPEGPNGFGPWNNILSGDASDACINVADTPGALPGITARPVPSGGEVVAGNIQQRICTAARNYRGTSTAAGPSGGRLACAWAVNNVLANANVSRVDGDSVRDMESVLRGGRGARIEASAAQCGDIVLVTGASNHVGICLNAGCSQVISNSSSRRSFSWMSGPTFAPSYNNPNYKIYRISN